MPPGIALHAKNRKMLVTPKFAKFPSAFHWINAGGAKSPSVVRLSYWSEGTPLLPATRHLFHKVHPLNPYPETKQAILRGGDAKW